MKRETQGAGFEVLDSQRKAAAEEGRRPGMGAGPVETTIERAAEETAATAEAVADEMASADRGEQAERGPKFGRTQRERRYESTPPAGGIGHAMAGQALADREAVAHLEHVFSKPVMAQEAEMAASWETMRERLTARRAWAESVGREGPRVPPPWTRVEPHSMESLLIGSTVRLAVQARQCAKAGGCFECPNATAACQGRRDKAHCPAHIVLERLDDIDHLYGPTYAERVVHVIQQVMPPLGARAKHLVASRGHQAGHRERVLVRWCIQHGMPPGGEEEEVA